MFKKEISHAIKISEMTQATEVRGDELLEISRGTSTLALPISFLATTVELTAVNTAIQEILGSKVDQTTYNQDSQDIAQAITDLQDNKVSISVYEAKMVAALHIRRLSYSHTPMGLL